MKPYIHILSHSKDFARQEANRLGIHPSDWRYIQGPQSLLGYGRIHLLRVGEFWKSPNYPEVDLLLQSMDVFEVDPKGGEKHLESPNAGL